MAFDFYFLCPSVLTCGLYFPMVSRNKMMDNECLKSIIECLLFVSNKPLTIKKIKEVLTDKDINMIEGTLIELQRDYNQRPSGLQIVEIAGGYQICTRPDYSEWIKKLEKAPQTFKLSISALETLSIIAYKQPITRAEIEKIRGVDAGGVICSLVTKKLIRVSGRKDCLGHPLLYATTSEFLKYFGLKNISEVPLLEEING